MYYSIEDTIDGEVAGVDVETETPSWTTFNYTAGKEYVLQVSTAYDKGSAVTMYAGINDTGFFANSDIAGAFEDWKGSKMKFVDANTYTFDFTNADTKTEFAIREKAGSWDVGSKVFLKIQQIERKQIWQMILLLQNMVKLQLL